MTDLHRHFKTTGTLLITTLLASCAQVRVYQPPSDIAQSAHLSLSLNDQSLLAGVAIISRIEGEIVCGEPLPNYQKMIVISKGNPLISNLNPSGTYIPTGQKFTFSAMGLNDGFRECGGILSFLPKAGSRYEITLTNATMRIAGAQPSTCPIEVMDVTRKVKTNENIAEPVEITYEQCHSHK